MVRHTEVPFLEECLCLIADAEFLRTRSHHSELFGAGRRQEDRGADGEEEHSQLERETEDGWYKQDEFHHEHTSDRFFDELCCLFDHSQPVFRKRCRRQAFSTEQKENAAEKHKRQDKEGNAQENP